MTGQDPGVVAVLGLATDLGREAGLADARLAHDHHEVRPAAGHRGGERRPQDHEVVVPADERCLRPGAAEARRRDGGDGLPRVDGLLATLHAQRAERLVPHGPVGRRVCHGTDDDLPGCGDRLEPAGGVHDVAHGRVVTAGAQGPDEDLTGVDADAHPQVGAGIAVELLEALLHPQPGAHRALGVVLVCDRGTEDRDERVADDLVDLPAVRDDVGGEPLEGAVDDVLHLLRVGALRETR